MPSNRLMAAGLPAMDEGTANTLMALANGTHLRRSVVDPDTGRAVLGPGAQAPSLADLAGGFIDLQAGRIRDAVTAPQRAYSGELPVYDPTTGHTTDAAREAASGMAGLAMTGGLGGLALKEGETALGAGPIRAYHGSPHDFDRFDISKIGTGEGAQVYGHGLYFAENEATAKAYRDALGAPARIDYADGPIPKHGGLTFADNPVRAAADALMAGGGNIKKAQTYARKNFGSQIDDVMAALDSGKLSYVPKQGRMYEVGIDADPARMLDWDAPISTQSNNVKDALFYSRSPNSIGELTGAEAYFKLARGLGKSSTAEGSAPAAELLRQREVPGIRYFDQGSRRYGDGTRNYVTFSDDIVSLIRKYGLAGAAGLGAAANAFAPYMQPPDRPGF